LNPPAKRAPKTGARVSAVVIKAMIAIGPHTTRTGIRAACVASEASSRESGPSVVTMTNLLMGDPGSTLGLAKASGGALNVPPGPSRHLGFLQSRLAEHEREALLSASAASS
jgi:hypothetical protein